MSSTWSGNLAKMKVSIDTNNEVEYKLPCSEQLIDMNELIGHTIAFQYAGEINCVVCQRKTKKSFNQGYCYPCLSKLAQCDTCIIKPELCHYAKGTCREPSWGEANCLQDHFVYLSNTGKIKVGITRHVSQGVSSRWVDQGATQAIALFRVKERLLSGLIEIELAKHMGDKTNWRTMLKGSPEAIDLVLKRDEAYALIQDKIDSLQQEHGLQAIQTISTAPVEINYPVIKYPEKIKSINLDKEFVFEGQLLGIKGQYLLLDQDRVINMRKYSGYHVNIQVF